ncbi:alpha/beta hydrolase [Echinicola marina]|uniref:alpha/beta hydrolase family protein n=1 Tax=Echinicola marina TaxID=2859768 RepID=UPI001CF63CF3|nr:alpha/beta hydrolase [Echinicola marina]UCS93167.1 alpha/beta hydrolase [Echinicola marina]
MIKVSLFLIINFWTFLWGGKGNVVLEKELQIHEESFLFRAADNLILTGTLSVPNNVSHNAIEKAVILVSPPLPISRDYGGLYSELADILLSNGIAVLRYDNRSFIDPALARKKDYTMHGQAADAEKAFMALHDDPRFTHAKIGLVGHSEGGAAVAIAASRNTEIDFVVLMSTQGIAGDELSYSQFSNALDKIYQGEEEIKAAMRSSVRKTIEIINRNEDIATMQGLLKESKRYYYEKYADKDPNLFGNLDKTYKMDSIQWLNPHRIAYIQFEPGLYYPKISCPALVIYGKMDEKLEWEENITGIENLFKSSSKSNYQVILLDSINHSYKQAQPSDSLNFLLGISQEMPKSKKRAYSRKSFLEVANWINREL